MWQSSSNAAYCSEYLGADHWGSLKVDGAWIKKMKKSGYKHVSTVGNHAFYASKVSQVKTEDLDNLTAKYMSGK